MRITEKSAIDSFALRPSRSCCLRRCIGNRSLNGAREDGKGGKERAFRLDDYSLEKARVLGVTSRGIGIGEHVRIGAPLEALGKHTTRSINDFSCCRRSILVGIDVQIGATVLLSRLHIGDVALDD
eukprot:TRINITY_DN3465_c1_g1_i9.p4 TRINITY_DN3465_c1_g1~~TRINITY_DN3465_c1_g1_i9.p4  ORF type:complete len:126 (-),score=9.16 TRINITY_DN3465_c1_g1_i9:2273-2650(-)